MQNIIHSLEAKGYVFLSKYSFRELVIPLREGLQTSSIFTLMMWYLIILGGIWAGVNYAFLHETSQMKLSTFLGWMAAGIPATFLLVPLHEMIHGWMFRWYGAKDVRYGVIWRYLMFYAVAHQFPVNYQQFRYIALAPFVVITLLCAGAYIWMPAEGKALIPGLYIFHTICCAGDFGLCAYFYKYRERQPVSFDDADSHTSWFYALPELPGANPEVNSEANHASDTENP